VAPSRPPRTFFFSKAFGERSPPFFLHVWRSGGTFPASYFATRSPHLPSFFLLSQDTSPTHSSATRAANSTPLLPPLPLRSRGSKTSAVLLAVCSFGDRSNGGPLPPFLAAEIQSMVYPLFFPCRSFLTLADGKQTASFRCISASGLHFFVEGARLRYSKGTGLPPPSFFWIPRRAENALPWPNPFLSGTSRSPRVLFKRSWNEDFPPFLFHRQGEGGAPSAFWAALVQGTQCSSTSREETAACFPLPGESEGSGWPFFPSSIFRW